MMRGWPWTTEGPLTESSKEFLSVIDQLDRVERQQQEYERISQQQALERQRYESQRQQFQSYHGLCDMY